MLGTEFLYDATAGASRIVRQIGPVSGVVIGDDQSIDRDGLRSARADVGPISSRNGGQRHLIGFHESFRARQSRQRNRLEAAPAEVIPDVLVLTLVVCEGVNVL